MHFGDNTWVSSSTEAKAWPNWQICRPFMFPHLLDVSFFWSLLNYRMFFSVISVWNVLINTSKEVHEWDEFISGFMLRFVKAVVHATVAVQHLHWFCLMERIQRRIHVLIFLPLDVHATFVCQTYNENFLFVDWPCIIRAHAMVYWMFFMKLFQITLCHWCSHEKKLCLQIYVQRL